MSYTAEQLKETEEAREQQIRKTVETFLPEFLCRLNQSMRRRAIEYTIERLKSELDASPN